MNSKLNVGDIAPPFTAMAVGGRYGTGKNLSLSDLTGSPVALYFYPRDDTPGCTVQACGIRDAWSDIVSTGAILFGISADSEKSHENFIAKLDLPFPLLSDTDRSIVERYGVWVEKSLYGKKYMGIERTSFVVDRKGKIAAILSKVKPADHAGLLIKALKGIEE